MDNHAAFYPLNFTMRLILLCCVSMVTSFCYAQYSALLHPVIATIVADQKNIFTEFNHSFKGTDKIPLQWKLNQSEPAAFFSIERSGNGKDFEMIEVLKLAPNDKFEFTDESPLRGRSFYRIKTMVKGKQLYSPVINVYVGADAPFKFYPNPADNIVIVRSDIPLDVQIADATGEVRVTLQKVQGLQTINVSSFEKGIYMIRFTNKVSNVVTTERLFKN